MNTRITIKAMEKKDVPFLSELLNLSQIRKSLHMEETIVSDWENAFAEWVADPDEENYIIWMEGIPVGWLSVNGLMDTETVWLKELVLHPRHHGQRIGSAALDIISVVLASRNYRKIRLHTDYDNIPAQKCYEKNGFCQVDYEPNRKVMTYEKTILPLEIISYLRNPNPVLWEQLHHCDWRAGHFLHGMLFTEGLQRTFGSFVEIFMLIQGEKLLGFMTLSEKEDYILIEDGTKPWLGFLCIMPQYRNHRLCSLLLEHGRNAAGAMGYEYVYLTTDHIGLYEKFGFTHIRTVNDRSGNPSKVYRKRT